MRHPREVEIGSVDRAAMWIRAGAEARVSDVEIRLRGCGLTLGSQPPSVLRGTVASWLEGPWAGRRAEDGRIGPGVAAIEAVLPDGAFVRTRPAPRSAAGPAVANLLLGGGGRFGRLVAATLKATRLHARTEELSVQGDPRQVARLIRQTAWGLLPPLEVELRGGAVVEAALSFPTGRPDQEARVTHAATEARSLGLTSAMSMGRGTGDESWEAEVPREALEALLLALPAGERVRLVRVARESAVAVASAAVGERLGAALSREATAAGGEALADLARRVAAALGGT